MRWIASIAIILSMAWVIDDAVLSPFDCNRRMKAGEQRTIRTISLGLPYEASRAARNTLASIEPCIRRSPQMVNLYMIAAANRRILDQHDAAIRLYHEALRYDRRPELYFELGVTYLYVNRRKEAERCFRLAGRFNPEFIQAIPDVNLQESVIRAIGSGEAQLSADLEAIAHLSPAAEQM